MYVNETVYCHCANEENNSDSESKNSKRTEELVWAIAGNEYPQVEKVAVVSLDMRSQQSDERVSCNHIVFGKP